MINRSKLDRYTRIRPRPHGSPPHTRHTKPQVDMIDESLKFAGVAPGSKLRTAVDVGCGIGGSSRHIVSHVDKEWMFVCDPDPATTVARG